MDVLNFFFWYISNFIYVWFLSKCCPVSSNLIMAVKRKTLRRTKTVSDRAIRKGFRYWFRRSNKNKLRQYKKRPYGRGGTVSSSARITAKLHYTSAFLLKLNYVCSMHFTLFWYSSAIGFAKSKNSVLNTLNAAESNNCFYMYACVLGLTKKLYFFCFSYHENIVQNDEKKFW